MDCIFCKIANGEINALTIYEDEIVSVFLDSHPDANGHILIVPKQHFLDLRDIDEVTLSYIMNIAKKMWSFLEDKLSIDGVTLIQNNGDVQHVKHYHLHLKPYYDPKQAILDPNEVYKTLKK